MQGEVAGAIADAFNAKLSGTEAAALAKKPTDNPAAYEAYLRGRALNLAGAGYANSRQAAAAYAEAVRQDPQFAAAWSQLSIVAGYLYFNNVDTDKYNAQFVKHASDTALQLQPQLDEAQIAQASYQYRVQRDFAGAERTLLALARTVATTTIVAFRCWDWSSAGRASGSLRSRTCSRRRRWTHATPVC